MTNLAVLLHFFCLAIKLNSNRDTVEHIRNKKRVQTLISGQYLLLMEYYCILHKFILFSLFLNILYEVWSAVKTSAKSRFLIFAQLKF